MPSFGLCFDTRNNGIFSCPKKRFVLEGSLFYELRVFISILSQYNDQKLNSQHVIVIMIIKGFLTLLISKNKIISVKLIRKCKNWGRKSVESH